MKRLLVIFPLLLTYLALTNNVHLPNIVGGLVVSIAVYLLIGAPTPNVPDLWRVPRASVELLHYIVLLLIDIIKCGLQVAYAVLHPRLPISPGIIAVPSRSPSKWITAISAHGITVTPGEMVIEIGQDNVMYVHALNSIASGVSAHDGQAARLRMLDSITLQDHQS